MCDWYRANNFARSLVLWFIITVSPRCLWLFLTAAFLAFSPNVSVAQVSKANLILMDRGLQIHGLVQPDDPFNFETLTNANYTGAKWQFAYSASNYSWNQMSKLGPAPGITWGRWVGNQSYMPPLGEEGAYLSQLVSLSYSDEPNFYDETVFTNMVNWFLSTETAWPNTIRFILNWAGQISDSVLSSFISQARPDMIAFDSYHHKSVYDTNAPNHIGPAIGGPNAVLPFYSELRRYRAWSQNYNIPFAIYRQTFHAVEEYAPYHVYRDPSPSEMRLNSFAALAFNAKMLVDFTYNSGASSLFDRTPEGQSAGDTYPNALYTEQAGINLRARNLGKALVRLRPIYDLHNPTNTSAPGPASGDPNFPDGYVTSIMFLRGKYISNGVTNFTPIVNSFYNDPASSSNVGNPNSSAYTWWEFQKNDPYLNGWSFTNKTGIKNDGLPGDVIISWLRPLDESLDGTNYNNEIYMMVVNGLTATNGTAADCLQEIKLNFSGLTGAMTNVIMLDSATGNLVTNGLPLVSTRRQLVLNLNGGDGVLFKFNTGAPFVGFYTPPQHKISAQIQTNTPLVTIQGVVGMRYQVEATSALPSTNWTVLTNFLLPSATFVFRDTSNSGEQRFYRVVRP